MKKFAALKLATLAGLALSSSALAQFSIVNNLPGSYVDIITPGQATYYNLGDDGFVDITTTVGNALLPAGTHRITNNGAIAWGNPGFTAFTNQPLPSPDLADGNLALAPYWDDLYTYNGVQGGQGVYVQEISGVLYITWNVGHIEIENSSGVVQLQVFSSGPVFAKYVYQSVQYGPGLSNAASATIGTQTNDANAEQYSYNTASITDGTVLSVVAAAPGACCLPDGSCTSALSNDCRAQGGTFQGVGVTCGSIVCPQPSRCCMFDGTCSMVVPSACTAGGGVSSSGTCAGSCPGYQMSTTIPGAFVDISGSGTYLGGGDDNSFVTDLPSTIANALFPAGTLHVNTNGSVGYDGPFAAYFNEAVPTPNFYDGNRGAAVFWDDLITGAGTGAGVYAQQIGNTLIVQWNNMDHYSSSPSTGTIQLKIFGGGSGPGGALAQYIYPDVDFGDANNFGASATIGYQLNGTTGIQFSFGEPRIQNGTVISLVAVGGTTPCYANCDNSTAPPILNVGDFTCFLQRFAAGDSYANCDNSTIPPVLNVGDFTCFLQRFAAGCP
jgi:hypothetical protein